VRVPREGVEEVPQVFVDQHVVHDAGGELVEVVGRGQIAVHQEVGDFQEGAVFGQFRDVVAPVAQDSLLAVDVRDRALAGPGVAQPAIHGDHAQVVAQGRNVHRNLALTAHRDGQLDGAPPERQIRELGHVCLPPGLRHAQPVPRSRTVPGFPL
jgi:hypothetical protein